MSAVAEQVASREAVLEIVIPVHNEEVALPEAIARLTAALAQMPWGWQVTIADNASTDATPLVARQLARDSDRVRVLTMAEKGRGRALKRAWTNSTSDVLVYMDVDLSTDLNALLPLVAPLLSGHSDIAVGSRLHRSARVVRGPKREFVSRSYNALLRSTLQVRFRDAQCGFKAIRRDVADVLLPLVEDDTWFFDTELLVIAERAGLRIHEVPVDWIDDPDSRVNIVQTACDDIRGVARLGWSLLRGHLPLSEVAARLGRDRARGRIGAQLAGFVAVGVLSTLAYAVLFLLLRQVWPALLANAVALLTTAIANTALNRRVSFGITGREHALRQHAQALGIFAAGLLATSAALWLLEHSAAASHHWIEVAVLTVVNLLVTVVRFAAMRMFIFRR